MAEITLLTESQSISIYHGNIFRVPARYPYEEWVDFMVFETQLADSPYGLVVSSGYKAGLILVRLPVESLSLEGGLDRIWVMENWESWIYPDCDISNIYLIDRYEAKPPA